MTDKKVVALFYIEGMAKCSCCSLSFQKEESSVLDECWHLYILREKLLWIHVVASFYLLLNFNDNKTKNVLLCLYIGVSVSTFHHMSLIANVVTFSVVYTSIGGWWHGLIPISVAERWCSDWHCSTK